MTEMGDLSQSRAVLIGVSQYFDPLFPNIPAAVNSLQGMQELLTDPELCGWPPDRINIIKDPASAADLNTKLYRLAAETAGTLLVYFVGHGIFTGRSELIMATGDTEYDAPELRGLEYSKIKRTLLGSLANSKIVILDCCYSGQALQALGGASEAAAVTTDGVYTLTASDHDKAAHVVPAAEQRNARTSFTDTLISVVRAGHPSLPPVLTLQSLFPLLQRQLAAKDLPEPNQLAIGTVGDFPFARNPASQQVAAPPVDDFGLRLAVQAYDWADLQLSQAGDNESATMAARQAVKVYRELAALDPGRYGGHLAKALERHGPWLEQALFIYRGSAPKTDIDGRTYGETYGDEGDQLEADRKWWPIAESRLSSLRLLVFVVGGLVTRIREVYGVDPAADSPNGKVALSVSAPLAAEEVLERYPTLPALLHEAWPTRPGPSREFVLF